MRLARGDEIDRRTNDQHSEDDITAERSDVGEAVLHPVRADGVGEIGRVAQSEEDGFVKGARVAFKRTVGNADEGQDAERDGADGDGRADLAERGLPQLGYEFFRRSGYHAV